MSCDDIFDRYLKPMVPIPTDRNVFGGPKAPVRAIIFDVYGTLFVSGSGDIGAGENPARSTDALEELIRSHGLKFSPEMLVQTFYNAIRAEHALMNANGIEYPEIRVEQIWSEVTGIRDPVEIKRFALAYELIVNPVWPMPGLDLLLAACRGAGLAMGIISNAQFYTPLLFRYFCGNLPEFLGFDPDLTVYSFAFGLAKPSPLLFDAVVHALGKKQIEPEGALYVGNDMRNDISAARAAGMQTALFAGDARSFRPRSDDPCCIGLIPDICITCLTQIPGRIGIPTPRAAISEPVTD